MKNFYTGLLFISILYSCKSKEATQIAENTFVYNAKVYKIVDNEISFICDLESDTIKKFQVSIPKLQSFGKGDLGYIKENAYTEMEALYRGATLYYKIKIEGLNDLKEDFTPGSLIIEFNDSHGFIIHSATLLTSDLIGQMNNERQVQGYEYDGKTEMSSEIYKAIIGYSVSSSVKRKTASPSIWNY